MASSLALSGVFSGIDAEVLIASSMSAARAPLSRLQQQKAAWQAKDDAVADLESRLEMFETQADSLYDDSTLRMMRGASSDTEIAGVTALAGAAEGNYNIQVNQLAESHRLVHTAGLAPTETWTHTTGVSDADDEYISADDISDAGGSDYKFVFQFAGETQVTVDLAAYDLTGITLNQLVSEINTAAGYTAASAPQVGGSYKLRIEAQNSGAGRDLTITDDNSVAILSATGAFSQTIDGDVGADALVGAGAFVYTYDGETRTITTTETTSLGDLRDMINNDAGNPGVVAGILHYGTTYHLILSGAESGSTHTISIDDVNTTIAFDTADFTQTQQAQNAEIRVDGFPSAGWIESSSNTITEAIPNVNITVNAVGATTIRISRDTSALKTGLINLIEIYNGILDKIRQYAGYDTATGQGGPLQGDSSINRMLDPLRAGVSSPVPGFLSGSDTFTLAAEIGLEVGGDSVSVDSGGNVTVDPTEIGHLSLDESALDDALASDYRAVLDLIGTFGTGASLDTGALQFNSADETTAGGDYEVSVTYDAGGTILAAKIRNEGQTAWRSMDVSGTVLTGQAGNPEQYLSLTATWDTSGAYTKITDVRVREGIARVLHDRAVGLLSDAGILTIKRDSYSNLDGTGAIDRIDDKIAAMEKRLASQEDRLRAKYARMETTLAKLDAQRGAFEAMFAALDAMNNSNKD